MNRLRHVVLVGASLVCAPSLVAQDDPIQTELDAFWAEVVRSVVDWDVRAQQATYHPDAIHVTGDADSYRTRRMVDAFAEVEAGAAADPSVRRVLEFRFSSRVHDASTAHEVGLYHFRVEGGDDFYGGLDSYLVKKDGRWLILVEIQRREGVSEAEWDALAPR